MRRPLLLLGATALSLSTCVAGSSSWFTTSSIPGTITEVLALFHPIEEEFKMGIFTSPNVSASRTVPGATFLGFRMTREDGDFSITQARSRVSLHLPATLLDVLGVDSLLGMMWTNDQQVLRSAMELDETGTEVVAEICVDLHLFSEDGVPLHVSDLQDAITLAMPVSNSDASCAWWNKTAKHWSFEGLMRIEGEEGMLTCNTTHLTYFGAIGEGFAMAFRCTQVQLLRVEALKELLKSEWRTSTVAVLYWSFLLLLASLLAAACAMDRCFPRHDEHFLVPQYDCASTPERVLSPFQVVSLSTHAQETLSFCCSSAWRDILDEFVSRWFAFFGELRAFCEGLCCGMAAQPGEGTQEGCEGVVSRTRGAAQKTVHSAMTSLLCSDAQRQACAALHLSMDTVHFITDDKQLGKLLLKAAKQRDSAGVSPAAQRLEDWRLLHVEVMRHIDARWNDPATWCSLPRQVARIFCMSNPLVTMFYQCCFQSRSRRVMLFACELLGAIMLCCVFFKASGGTASKRNKSGCSSSGLLYDLGQLVAIAVASLFMAGIPVLVLSALHYRTLCEVDYEGCEAWHRKLRAWRLQAAIFWLFSSLYAGASALFICLFLANVSPADHTSVGTSAAIQVVEDCLVIPLGVAAFVPALTGAAVSLAWRLRGGCKDELLAKSRGEVAQTGNWHEFLREDSI